MSSQPHSRTLPRYLLVGALNTFVGYCAIISFQLGLGWGAVAANAGGYALGLVLSYLLNRRFTFSSGRSHRALLPGFLGVTAIAYALNVLVLQGVLALGRPAVLAQAAAVVTYTVVSYLLHRQVVFARDGPC